jgi:hypothetical protein
MSAQTSAEDHPSISKLSLNQPKHYRPKSSSLPTTLVRTISIASDGDTELAIQLFADRNFLSVTQLNGKLGTLLVCNVEESVIDNSTTYNIKTLIGTGVSRGSSLDGDTEVALREVFVRQISEKILKYSRSAAGVGENTILGEDGSSSIPPLVVGLGLKSFGREDFQKIVEAAMQLYVDAMAVRLGGMGSGMECPD